MSDLCHTSDGHEGGPCAMLAILNDEKLKHEEQQEMASEQACVIGEARVLEQPNLYKEEEQERRLSLKAPSLIQGNHANNVMTEGADKKLQYALRSNPKKSRRFMEPDQTKSSATAASSINIISSITTCITSITSEIATATAAPLPSPPPPAAPVKKPNSMFSEKASACTECGKQFSSWKALFGHMRCHPERQWRGIQPPSSMPTIEKPTKHGKAPSPISKAPPIKYPQSENSRAHAPLHGYLHESDTESIEAAYINERDQHSPKPQRNSKSHLPDHIVLSCQFSHSPSPTESEVMDEFDMADCLVMLAFAAKTEAAAEPSDCNSGQEEPGFVVHSRGPLIASESRMKKRSYSCMQKSVHPIQAKEVTKYDEDGTRERKSKFECSTCKKQFRSHQALGGHRASHKKVKGCFARTNAPEDISLPQIEETKTTTEEETMTDMQQEETLDAAEEKGGEQDDVPEHCKMSMGQFLQYSMTCHEKIAEDKHDSATTLESKQIKHQTSSCSSSSSIIAATAAAGTLLMRHHNHHYRQQQLLLPKIHQCTVCSRIFSTGQALGGHKRCHWGASAAPNNNQKGTDSDMDCAENSQICLSSSLSEQLQVTDMALKKQFESCGNRGLGFTPLGDTKDGLASPCNWLMKGYALDLDVNKMMLKTGHDDKGANHGLNQEKYLSVEFSSHANAITRSSSAAGMAWCGRFLSPRCEESSNVISCHHRNQQVSFYEKDVDDSAEAKQHNARPPKEELLDLNLPAPVEDTEEAHPAAHALCSPADVALHSHEKVCGSSCPCFTSLGNPPPQGNCLGAAHLS